MFFLFTRYDREHICSDFPCHLREILYHHTFLVPTNFEYPQMIVPQILSINKFLSMNTNSTHEINFLSTQKLIVPTNLSRADFEY